MPKIFDPFFSTRTNGTGLGLAIAYSVVRKHDGVIRVESHAGAGTTFTIYLPVSPSGRARRPPNRPAAARAAGERVLFMDDDPDIRDLAGAILALMGYEPTLTCEGGETLSRVPEVRGRRVSPYAAVILDLTIPGGMGGRETIRRLREIDPERAGHRVERLQQRRGDRGFPRAWFRGDGGQAVPDGRPRQGAQRGGVGRVRGWITSEVAVLGGAASPYLAMFVRLLHVRRRGTFYL